MQFVTTKGCWADELQNLKTEKGNYQKTEGQERQKQNSFSSNTDKVLIDGQQNLQAVPDKNPRLSLIKEPGSGGTSGLHQWTWFVEGFLVVSHDASWQMFSWKGNFYQQVFRLTLLGGTSKMANYISNTNYTYFTACALKFPGKWHLRKPKLWLKMACKIIYAKRRGRKGQDTEEKMDLSGHSISSGVLNNHLELGNPEPHWPHLWTGHSRGRQAAWW